MQEYLRLMTMRGAVAGVITGVALGLLVKIWACVCP